jgi:hypothetical protein
VTVSVTASPTTVARPSEEVVAALISVESSVRISFGETAPTPMGNGIRFDAGEHIILVRGDLTIIALTDTATVNILWLRQRDGVFHGALSGLSRIGRLGRTSR